MQCNEPYKLQTLANIIAIPVALYSSVDFLKDSLLAGVSDCLISYKV